MRVIAAMSGGVDSSLAAALMVEEGHEVIGVTLKLLPSGAWETESGCCSAEAARDARTVAGKLGIAHYVLDAAEEFERDVIAPFASAYAAGLTPNPCVRCNETVKFGWMVRRAKELSGERLVTGHYARTDLGGDGTVRLLRAADPAKDQSYFLYRLPQEALSFAGFPVGGMTKASVREAAKARGLPVWDKPDSQEVCFVRGDDGHLPLVAQRHPEAVREGEVVDAGGRVLGRHPGYAAFTVGQRRGVGVAERGRSYVLSVSPERNRVVVGPRAAAMRGELVATDCRWIAGAAPEAEFRAAVRIRSMHDPAPAAVVPEAGARARVRFDEPQFGVAPGQSAVFYVRDCVAGGGVIAPPA